MPVLDVIRGIAALLVVAGHTRSQIEHFYGHSARDLPVLWKLILLPSSVAQESVAVFFVLSGYLVGGQVLRQVGQSRFEWRTFLAKRLSRMWTVLIPGLLFTAGIGIVLGRTYGEPVVGPAKVRGSSPADYVCNALFGQEARCSPAGSNDSLWSLSYEFWFYVIFASIVVCLAAALRRRLIVALMNLIVAVAAAAYFTPMVFLFMVSWLYGVVASRWSSRGSLRWIFTARHACAFWVMMVAISMIVSSLMHLSRIVMFMEVGLPAAGLVLAGSAAQVELSRIRMRIGSWLGTCSFSMYVFHLPMVALVTSACVDWSIGDTPAEVAVVAYTLSVIAVPASMGVWWLFERHTGRFRDLLFKVFGVASEMRPPSVAESLS